MKKKLEAELISIAHRILKLKGKDDVLKMHTEVSELYEKLSVLKFANENFDSNIPTIGSDSSFFGMLDSAFNNKISDTIEVEDKIYINLDERENDTITEPVINKIKDMVAQMPEEQQKTEPVLKNQDFKNDSLEDITAGFKDTPVFEPVSKVNGNLNDKKSLNDKLKLGTITIGLNDKIAFIKHLFDGKSEDYDRVLSQLNTIDTFKNAKSFIQDMVKPDYNNWVDKEEFEIRFIDIIESRFN